MDGFYEFTEPKVRGRKTKWLFRMEGEPWFWIAGLVKNDAWAMLTTAPGPDVAPYHDRQIVLLRREEALDWLDLGRPETELLRPRPFATLSVERAFPL